MCLHTLYRFTDVRDELAAIGDAVPDTKLVRTTLQGFPKSWEVFVESIVYREYLLGWDGVIVSRMRSVDLMVAW